MIYQQINTCTYFIIHDIIIHIYSYIFTRVSAEEIKVPLSLNVPYVHALAATESHGNLFGNKEEIE